MPPKTLNPKPSPAGIFLGGEFSPGKKKKKKKKKKKFPVNRKKRIFF
jgi:hypothetical protein